MPQYYPLPHPSMGCGHPMSFREWLSEISNPEASWKRWDSTIRWLLLEQQVKRCRPAIVGFRQWMKRADGSTCVQFLPVITTDSRDPVAWLLDAPFWSRPLVHVFQLVKGIACSCSTFQELLDRIESLPWGNFPIDQSLSDTDTQGIVRSMEGKWYPIPARLTVSAGSVCGEAMVIEPVVRTTSRFWKAVLQCMIYLIPRRRRRFELANFHPKRCFAYWQTYPDEEWFEVYRMMGILADNTDARILFLQLPFEEQIRLLKEPVPHHQMGLFRLVKSLFADPTPLASSNV